MSLRAGIEEFSAVNRGTNADAASRLPVARRRRTQPSIVGPSPIVLIVAQNYSKSEGRFVRGAAKGVVGSTEICRRRPQ